MKRYPLRRCVMLLFLAATFPAPALALTPSQRLILQGSALEGKGDHAGAIELYRRALDQSDDEPRVANLARRNLVPLLLNQDDPDLDAVARHLAAMRESGIDVEEISPLVYQWLFKRVAGAEPAAQAKVWDESFQQPLIAEVPFPESHLDHLNTWVDALGPHSSLKADRVFESLMPRLSPQAAEVVQTRFRADQVRVLMGMQIMDPTPRQAPAVPTAEIRKQMLRANVLSRTGNAQEATAIYQKIIDNPATAPKLRALTRRRLLDLLLSSDLRAPDLAEQQLRAIAQETGWTPQLWNDRLCLLLQRVELAPTAEREAVWTQGLESIPRSQDAVLDVGTLGHLDRLTDSLGPNESFSAQRVLKDLLARFADQPQLNKALQDRLATQAIRWRLATSARDAAGGVSPEGVPSELRQLLMQANSARLAGQNDDAAALYQQVIDEFPAQRRIVQLARRNLVLLLLQRQPAPLASVRKHFDALLAEQGHHTPESWSYACRIGLAAVRQAPAAERPAVWRRVFTELATARDQTDMDSWVLTDLERTLDVLDQSSDFPPLTLLTDMLVLTPTTPAMRRIQQGRIKALWAKGDQANMARAAWLDAMLALTTSDGPLVSFDRTASLLANAAQDGGEAVAPLEDRLLDGAASVSAAADPSTMARPDDALRRAARQALQDAERPLPARDRAYLLVWAGESEEGLRSAGKALRASGETSQIQSCLLDTTALLAITDGGFEKAGRVLVYMTDPPPAPPDVYLEAFLEGYRAVDETAAVSTDVGDYRPPAAVQPGMASPVLNRWRQRLTRWGVEALGLNRPHWPQTFWAVALRGMSDDEEKTTWLDRIVDEAELAQAAQDPAVTIGAIRRLAAKVDHPDDQRRLQIRIAALEFEAGRFEQVLAELDAIQGLKRDAHDIQIGFMRAMSLIRLSRLDEAVEQLDAMTYWNGTDEEMARASFLIGWVYLQQLQTQKALMALRVVTDKYPRTGFAVKARELIQRLEGL